MKSRQRASRKKGALLGTPLAEGTGSGRAREVTLVTREALLPSHNPRVRGLFERTRTTCRSPVPSFRVPVARESAENDGADAGVLRNIEGRIR